MSQCVNRQTDGWTDRQTDRLIVNTNLARVQMTESSDGLLFIKVSGGGFHAADGQHLPVEMHGVLLRDMEGRVGTGV